jgi:hypothetical protein
VTRIAELALYLSALTPVGRTAVRLDVVRGHRLALRLYVRGQKGDVSSDPDTLDGTPPKNTCRRFEIRGTCPPDDAFSAASGA